MSKRIVLCASVAALAGALALVGYWLLFTTFMVYDDEGYILWSVRSYLAEGGLYDRVFSQYGPFFYVLHDSLVTGFRLPLDNESARWLALVYWGGCAALGSAMVWRLTASRTLAAAAAVLVFATLTPMINEPGHPGGLLALMGAAGALAGINAILRPSGGAWSVAAIVGVLMALTKINVGGFFLISLAAWWTLNARSPRVARVAPWIIAVGSVVLPLLLMRGLWPERWVTTFAMVFSCAALGLTLGIARLRSHEFGWRTWAYSGLAAAIAAIAVVAPVVIRGTSLSGLVDGVILSPLRHPSIYSNEAAWPWSAPVLAIASLALAVLIHRHPAASWRPPLLAALRLAAVLWFLPTVAVDRFGALAIFSFKYGPTFAWLMAVPLQAGSATSSDRARAWLAWVFVWQTLQAYPIAGSQVAWGSFLWAPLALSSWRDAARYWSARPPLRISRFLQWHPLLPALAACWAWLALAVPAHSRYRADDPVQLPGAESLRVPRGHADQLRIMTANARLHGTTVFSFPGMFSFNLWTGRPTPTSNNVTHWFSLLGASQQRDIVDQLQADPHAVVIIHPPHLKHLWDRGLAPSGLLIDHLLQAFEPALRLYAYELWVRAGRSIAPVSTGVLATDDAPDRWHLEFITMAAGKPAVLEWHDSNAPYDEAFRLSPSEASPWEVTPLAVDGTASGPSILLDQPAALPPLTRIVVRFRLPPNSGFPPHPHIILRDAAGNILDRLRLRK